MAYFMVPLMLEITCMMHNICSCWCKMATHQTILVMKYKLKHKSDTRSAFYKRNLPTVSLRIG